MILWFPELAFFVSGQDSTKIHATKYILITWYFVKEFVKVFGLLLHAVEASAYKPKQIVKRSLFLG